MKLLWIFGLGIAVLLMGKYIFTVL